MMNNNTIKQKFGAILDECEASFPAHAIAEEHDEEFMHFLNSVANENANDLDDIIENNIEEFIYDIKSFAKYSKSPNLIALGFIANVAVLNIALNSDVSDKNLIVAKSILVKALEASLSYVASLVTEAPEELMTLVKRETLQALGWLDGMKDAIAKAYSDAANIEVQIISDLKAALEK